ncbi:LysM peptidoglycan-binding domain-containing protein [Salinadaptatus halalkaliphilus]|uniref:LysM peptidoglycan-binding domain-containing protein n=1 Tax=Salinadaptatus halalkaliphilus TaxID=2419781 RepID=A0A4S3TNP3_9EURY|nr:LysM peptidoglycan-binding domain-containing protein [Salinadaptatus halalkaliphilus]THE64843.1 LysM peptidoglycan-binding domain-containing protein [Salinadaptatus halalkaliphilus]
MTNGKLEKAQITILNGKKQGDQIECKFNPSSYTLEKSVNYGEMKATGSGASIMQFVDGNAETLSMELFFDTTDELGSENSSSAQLDVRENYTKYIDHLLAVDGELHAPPVCQFVWGDGIDFTALVQRANKQFTKFLPSGIPIRARVSILFKEYKTADYHKSEVSPESTDKTKVWTVSEGDTLWLIADEEYSDPAHWRTIADQNEIDNPRAIEPGEKLELPPL